MSKQLAASRGLILDRGFILNMHRRKRGYRVTDGDMLVQHICLFALYNPLYVPRVWQCGNECEMFISTGSTGFDDVMVLWIYATVSRT